MRESAWIRGAGIGLLLLLLAAVTAYWILGIAASEPVDLPTKHASVGDGLELARSQTRDVSAEPSRTVVVDVAEEPPGEPSQEPDIAEVRFTVVDAEQQPVSAATVRLSRSSSGGFELLKDVVDDTSSDQRVLQTDRGGVATTMVAVDRGYSYTVTAAGFEPSRGSVAGGDHRRVQLDRLFALSVAVRSARDLRQFPGLNISAVRSEPYQRATTPIDDGYPERTMQLCAGEWELRAQSANAYSDAVTVRLGPQTKATARVVLELGTVEVRTGQVVDAGSGAPIAGARIAWHIDFRDAAVTDAAGHFAIAQPDGDWTRQAYCSGMAGAVPGHARRAVKLAEAFTRIELIGARQCTGRVLSAAGEAVAGALVVAVAYDRGYGQRLESVRTTTDERGAWSLGNLRDGDVYWFAAMAAGHGPAFEFRPIEAENPAIELRLTEPATLIGRLVANDGELHDGMVRARLLDSPTRATFLRRPVVLERHLGDRELPLVANRFLAEGLLPGRYQLRYSDAHGAVTTGTVELAAGSNRIDLEEHQALTITGHLRVVGGEPSPAHRYMVVLEGHDHEGTYVHRGIRLQPHRLDYLLGGVESGSYRMEVLALGLRDAKPVAVEVAGGEQGVELTIDVAGATPAKPQTSGVMR